LVRKSDGCFDLPWLKLISMCTFTAIIGLEAVFEVFGKASVKVFGRIYRFKNIDIIEILISSFGVHPSLLNCVSKSEGWRWGESNIRPPL